MRVERAADPAKEVVVFVVGRIGEHSPEVVVATWSAAVARVSVRQQLIIVDHDLRFTEPKTNRGRRTVDLDPKTVRILRKHRSRQLSDRLLWGEGYEDLNLVFAREDGSPVRPDWFSKRFAVLVRRQPLPRIRFHDLRHTNATLALQAGVPPKVISDRLGHATVAFTMDVYAHAVPAMQEEAARRLGAIVFDTQH